MNRGTIATLVMVLLGAVMASYAWWHQVQRGKQIHQTWGTTAVQLIRHAPQVEVLWLQNSGDSSHPPIQDDGRHYTIWKKKDVTNVPGLVHARHALISDFNYLWDADTPSAGSTTWGYALRFSDDPNSCTLFFEHKSGYVKLLNGQQVLLHEKIRDSLLEFINRLEET